MGAVPRARFRTAQDAHGEARGGRFAQHLPAGRDGEARLHLRERRPAGRARLTPVRASGTSLPIDEALPELTTILRSHQAAVLAAPPGAGKTTRVPLALIEEPWAANRKILVLEPRRLAARAAAGRMAWTLGE